MLVRCNACGKDLQSDGHRIISCGCSNMTSVHDDVVSANDMDQVIILPVSYTHLTLPTTPYV